MSAQSVETILSRAMSDAKFADSLFADPERALSGYELSAEEAITLKGMTRADLDSVAASSPEERKSFALTLNHNQSILTVCK